MQIGEAGWSGEAKVSGAGGGEGEGERSSAGGKRSSSAGGGAEQQRRWERRRGAKARRSGGEEGSGWRARAKAARVTRRGTKARRAGENAVRRAGRRVSWRWGPDLKRAALNVAEFLEGGPSGQWARPDDNTNFHPAKVRVLHLVHPGPFFGPLPRI